MGPKPLTDSRQTRLLIGPVVLLILISQILCETQDHKKDCLSIDRSLSFYKNESTSCLRCDTCAQNLFDVLHDISENLGYYRDLIDPSRLTNSFNVKVSDLQSRTNDLQLALDNSQDLLLRSTRGFNRLILSSDSSSIYLRDGLYKADQFLDDYEVDLITKIKNENATFHMGVEHACKFSRTLINQTQELLSRSNKISDVVLLIFRELEYVEQAYKNEQGKGLIEVGGLKFKSLMRELEGMSLEQSLADKNLTIILDDLKFHTKSLDNIIQRISSLDVASSPETSINRIVKTLVCPIDCGSWPVELLEHRHTHLAICLNKTNNLNNKLSDMTRLVESNQLLESNLKFSREKLLMKSRLTNITLSNLRNRFSSSSRLITHLFEQVANIDMTVLSALKNQTSELTSKSSSLADWLNLDIRTNESDILNQANWISSIILSQLEPIGSSFDWKLLIDSADIIHDIDEKLHQVDDATKRIQDFLDPFIDSKHMSTLTDSLEVSNELKGSLVVDIAKWQSFVDRLKDDVEWNKQYASQLMQEVELILTHRIKDKQQSRDRLELKTSKTIEFVKVIENLQFMTLNQTRIFSSNLADLLHDDASQPNDLNEPDRGLKDFDLSAMEKRYVEILNRTNEARSYILDKNSTNYALKVGESLRSLQNRVEIVRLRLSKANISLTVDQDPIEGISLKIPSGIREKSTYHSVSFFMKPGPKEDGLILFIGTPTRKMPSKDGESLESKLYNEYMIILMRKRKLVVLSRLGPQAIDEIEDDVDLLEGSWYKIHVIRIGTIIRISVHSSQSISSLTRSLPGSHTVMNLGNPESVISILGFNGSIKLGGLDDQSKMSIYSQNISGFVGQIDRLKVNDEDVGLLNANQILMGKSKGFNSNIHISSAREWLTSEGFADEKAFEYKLAHLAFFPRSKSNISSLFVQFPGNITNSDLRVSANDHREHESGELNNKAQIRRLSMRFRTYQSNSLLLHHSNLDHSYFMSIYILGGRLTLAFHSGLKSRVESHFGLDDGQWHAIYLTLSLVGGHENQNGNLKLEIVIDDQYLFHDSFDTNFGPIPDHEYQSDLSRPDQSYTQENDSTRSGTSTDAIISHQDRSNSILYLGGVEDKYIPLLRNQRIPASFHGCIADVTINDFCLDFDRASKNQGIVMNRCLFNEQ